MTGAVRDVVAAIGIAVVLVTIANVVAVLLVPRGRVSWLFRVQTGWSRGSSAS